MNPRPTSITVVGWIMSALGLLALCGGLQSLVLTPTLKNDPKYAQLYKLMEESPVPIEVQQALAILGPIVVLICGLGVLGGHNWARFLYAGWNIVGSVFGLATSPMKLMMIPGMLIFAVICYFLFRRPANAYFTGKAPLDHGQ